MNELFHTLGAIHETLRSIDNKLAALRSGCLLATQQDLHEMERRLSGKLDKMAATLDQLVQDVNDESTLEDSIITLLNGIQAQLTAALAGTTLPTAVQAKVDAAFATLEANKAKLAAAITANTPAAPAPAAPAA